jgi:phosphatidylserine decarboxylase
VQGRRNPFVAREGIPFLLATAFLIWATWRYLPHVWLPLPVAASLVVFLVFRDPVRQIPSSALGVVSPVDGTIVSVESVDGGALLGWAHRIVIRIDVMGTYTARSPIEGQVKSLAGEAAVADHDFPTSALWIRTDEGDNVVMSFSGFPFKVPPHALVRYGERLGQGQRCAYLRLARFVQVYLPEECKIAATPGQTVVAGSDLLGSVPHH